MQRQRVMPDIFDIVRSFTIKISVPVICNQPSFSVAIIILNSSSVSSFLSVVWYMCLGFNLFFLNSLLEVSG